MKIRVFIIILSCIVFGCGPKKGIVTKKKASKQKTEVADAKNNAEKTSELPKKSNKIRTKWSVDTYIDTFSAAAMAEMRTSNIPASITLAQGILESGSGNGRLAVEANNHFGIKCHGWEGEKIYHDDDRSQECFRKYNNASESFKDHSEFLTGRKRYAKLFELKPNDYKGWARGLKAAGYATDKRYPKKLIDLIERYELYKYDGEVLKGNEVLDASPVLPLSHIVVKGDTLYSISKRYGVSVDDLKQLNKLEDNTLSIGQVIIIKSE